MLKPWFLLPASWAHELSPWVLPIYSGFKGPSLENSLAHKKQYQWHSLSWRGLFFRNPLGIAGGVDKNAENIQDWVRLGTGFVEVGTITPLPQLANPGKIIDRDLATQALWNKMGFPNSGCSELLLNIQEQQEQLNKLQIPVFVNIGKNRSTPNEQAFLDYTQCMQVLAPIADVFVINISSPNTTGLRQLQNTEELKNFLKKIENFRQQEKIPQPVLLKLSPDISDTEFLNTLEIALSYKIDGFILTNTTLQREPKSPFPVEGGVSGRPLQKLSLKKLELARNFLDAYKDRDLLLVSAGGVIAPQDGFDRLKAGANLVQTYSGLIYTGPDFFMLAARKFKNNESRTVSI